jgi:hypothetical protein
MDTIHEQALLLESLSDKVLHQLPPAVWKQLFLGSGRDSIRFEQRHLTLVYVDAEPRVAPAGSTTEKFYQELQRISARHQGRLDPYVEAAALVTFDDPGAAVRMAMELQRASGSIPLRIGVVSGVCTLAYFRAQDRLWCTPLGGQPARAAEVAASAAVGGIVISPEACEPSEIRVRHAALPHGHGDFSESELDLSSLALDIAVDGIDIRC